MRASRGGNDPCGAAINSRFTRQTTPGKSVEAKRNRRAGHDQGDCDERSGEKCPTRHEDYWLQNQRMLFDHVHGSKNAPWVRSGQARAILTSPQRQREKRSLLRAALFPLLAFVRLAPEVPFDWERSQQIA